MEAPLVGASAGIEASDDGKGPLSFAQSRFALQEGKCGASDGIEQGGHDVHLGEKSCGASLAWNLHVERYASLAFREVGVVKEVPLIEEFFPMIACEYDERFFGGDL